MLKLNNTTDKILAGILIVGIVFVGYTIFGNGTKNINLGKTKSDNVSGVTSKKRVAKNKEVIKGGQVWVEFDKKELKAGDNFEAKIYADTAGEKIGAFNMYFKFDPKNVTINIKKGENGLMPGNDTLKYMIMANPNDVSKGSYRFAGITATNHAKGQRTNLAIINLTAVKKFQIDTNFDWLKVNELASDLGKSFDIDYLQKNIVIK